MKILSKQDFNQNESKNFVVDNLSSAPSNPVLGQIYYNTQEERAYICIKAGETPEWADLTFSDYDSLPIGSMIPYSSTTIPSSWLECNGQAVSRTVYEGLFNVIGTTYGSGDGSTTFNVPNRKGRVGVGLDANDTDFDTIGKTGGSKYLQSHTHTFQTNRPAGNSTLWSIQEAINLQGGNAVLSDYPYLTDNPVTLKSTGDGDSENIQPYIVDTYIIKCFQSVDVSDVTYDSLPVGTELDYDGDVVPSGYEEIVDPNSYSTSEVKTNETWIDGKPIYRTVYNIGSLPNASEKTIPTGYDPSAITVLNIYGFARYNSLDSRITFPLPYATNNTLETIKIAIMSGNITITTAQDRSGASGYVTLEYTKTTN